MRRAMLAVVVLSLVACKSSTGPPGPLQGSWSGFVPASFTFDANLTDHGGTVGGSGDMSGPSISGGGPILLSITGGENGSTYKMTLTSGGLSGVVTVTGVLFS